MAIPSFADFQQSQYGNVLPPPGAGGNTPTAPSGGDSGAPQTPDNPFTHGPAGWLANALPMAGQVGGASLGGILGIESGPGAIATAGLGGAAGGSLGEYLKELLQGSQVNPTSIAKEGVLGAAGGATGEIAGPLIGKAADAVGTLIPGVKGIANIGNDALAKLFGVGDAKLGADSLVTVAKKEGLTGMGLGDLTAMKQNALRALGSAGDRIGSMLGLADQQGAGIAKDDLLKLVDDAAPKMNADPNAAANMIKGAQNIINGVVPNVQGAEAGAINVPTTILNELKQYFAENSHFSGEAEKQFAENIASGIRDKISGAVPGVADANQRWWALKQIANHIQDNLEGTAALSGRGSLVSGTRMGLMRNPYVLATIARGADALPTAITQKVISDQQAASGPQAPSTPPGSSVTPAPTGGVDQYTPGSSNGEIGVRPVRSPVSANAPARADLEKAALLDLVQNKGRESPKIEALLNYYYPKLKAPPNPSNTLMGTLLQAGRANGIIPQ